MLQTLDGLDLFIVELTELPVRYLPISDGGNRMHRPYADVLDTAIRTGVVTKPGKYGIHIDFDTQRWNIYNIHD